jgi:DNA-binding transcriptional regulator YiaG
MSNLLTELKSEISRISKKQIRTDSLALKKSNLQLRSDIADLKRRITALEVAAKKMLKGQQASPQPKAEESIAAPSLRFSAEGFSSLRKKLGLSGNDMAKLLGVSNQSVYHWESGKSKPRAAQLAAISQIRKLGKKEAAEKLAATPE